MKYQEVKEYYSSGRRMRQYFLDENGNRRGEHRYYHKNGKLSCHYFQYHDYDYGEVKQINDDGTIRHHYLTDGKDNELADVINCGNPATHTEEQLIEIAKEHNLPLLSDIPKTEAERTHWNLKWPDLPYLEVETMST